MKQKREPKVPINITVTAKEYEVVINIAEVYHCSRNAAARLAFYRGLQQLCPQARLPDTPPHDHLFRK